MVDLKDTCVHPQTHKPYIISGKGGVNNSPEGHAVSGANPHFKIALNVI